MSANAPERDPRLAEILRVQSGGGTFAEAREHAGLSRGQVRELSGILASRVRAIEEDPACVTAEEWMVFVALYDATGFTTPRPRGETRTFSRCNDCHALWFSDESERHTSQCPLLREIRARNGR